MIDQCEQSAARAPHYSPVSENGNVVTGPEKGVPATYTSYSVPALWMNSSSAPLPRPPVQADGLSPGAFQGLDNNMTLVSRLEFLVEARTQRSVVDGVRRNTIGRRYLDGCS
jgi:hypothetical protein